MSYIERIGTDTVTLPGTDQAVAAAAALNALMEITGGATIERQRAVLRELGQRFGLDGTSARQVALLGAWAANQQDRPEETLRAVADADALRDMTVAVFADPAGALPFRITRALEERCA